MILVFNDLFLNEVADTAVDANNATDRDNRDSREGGGAGPL